MKLLVVEDEAKTARYLRRGLSEEGYSVDLASSGDSADELVSVNLYDLIILDIMLPEVDGLTLCRRWREGARDTPILFLTARDTVEDRVRGLDAGGDDYLVKPFAFEELLARVRALLRRPATQVQDVLQVGDLRLLPSRRTVVLGDQEIDLSAREYRLLEYLVRHAGRIVTRTTLWEHAWETGTEPTSNVVDVYVGYLRKKLGPEWIHTVRGSGYLLRRK